MTNSTIDLDKLEAHGAHRQQRPPARRAGSSACPSQRGRVERNSMSEHNTLPHVVMLHTDRTRMSIVHENEHIPYRRRLGTIELAEGQAAKLLPREVGSDGGNPVFEEIGQVWIEFVDATNAD